MPQPIRQGECVCSVAARSTLATIHIERVANLEPLAN